MAKATLEILLRDLAGQAGGNIPQAPAGRQVERQQPAGIPEIEPAPPSAFSAEVVSTAQPQQQRGGLIDQPIQFDRVVQPLETISDQGRQSTGTLEKIHDLVEGISRTGPKQQQQDQKNQRQAAPQQQQRQPQQPRAETPTTNVGQVIASEFVDIKRMMSSAARQQRIEPKEFQKIQPQSRDWFYDDPKRERSAENVAFSQPPDFSRPAVPEQQRQEPPQRQAFPQQKSQPFERPDFPVSQERVFERPDFPQTQDVTFERVKFPESREVTRSPQQRMDRPLGGLFFSSAEDFRTRTGAQRLRQRVESPTQTSQQRANITVDLGKELRRVGSKNLMESIPQPEATPTTMERVQRVGGAGLQIATMIGGPFAAIAASAKGTGAALGRLAAVLGPAAPLAIAVGGIAVAIGAAGATVKKFVALMKDQVEKTQDISIDVAAAVATTDIERGKAMRRRAMEIGPALAQFERNQAAIEVAGMDVVTEILKLSINNFNRLEPLLKSIVLSLRGIEKFMEMANTANETLLFATEMFAKEVKDRLPTGIKEMLGPVMALIEKWFAMADELEDRFDKDDPFYKMFREEFMTTGLPPLDTPTHLPPYSIPAVTGRGGKRDERD